MTNTDPENERQRLAKVYGALSEDELEDLADNAYTLTDVARQALRAEITRRGLGIALRDSAEDEESSRFVTVRKFMNVPDALLAKTILDSAGLECYLGDEHIVRMHWFWSSFMGGVKLRVREEDVATAAELLDQGPPEAFDVDGVGEYKQPRCPNCQSLDVSFEELDKPVAYGSLAGVWFTGLLPPIPIPLKRLGWNCHSCGYAWEESGNDIQQP